MPRRVATPGRYPSICGPKGPKLEPCASVSGHRTELKHFLISIALTATAVAHANDAWEQAINQSLWPLRMTSNFALHLEGTEWINNAYAPIQCDLQYTTRLDGNRPISQVQLITYLNGRVADRIVGDGTSLYVYNCRTYEYSATRYGSYDGKPTANYQRDLILLVSAAARGSATYPARLFREVFSGDAVEYRSWAPGAKPFGIVNGMSIKDPIQSKRVYQPSPAEQVWQFTSSGRRSLAFTVGVSNGYELSKIEFYEAFKIGSNNRLTEWVMSVYRDTPIDAANFVPYAQNQLRGWRVVPSQKPGG